MSFFWIFFWIFLLYSVSYFICWVVVGFVFFEKLGCGLKTGTYYYCCFPLFFHGDAYTLSFSWLVLIALCNWRTVISRGWGGGRPERPRYVR